MTLAEIAQLQLVARQQAKAERDKASGVVRREQLLVRARQDYARLMEPADLETDAPVVSQITWRDEVPVLTIDGIRLQFEPRSTHYSHPAFRLVRPCECGELVAGAVFTSLESLACALSEEPESCRACRDAEPRAETPKPTLTVAERLLETLEMFVDEQIARQA